MKEQDEVDIMLEGDWPDPTHNTTFDHGNLPSMDITFANYQLLQWPWRKILIIKVLGRNIVHKLLIQHISELKKLDWACKFIDLEGGYYLVCF